MDDGRDEETSYRLLSRRKVFQNSKFEVFADTLSFSNDDLVDDYLSVIPLLQTEDGTTGVAVLPVVEGRIALLLIDRHPMGWRGWEIPRGFVDSGETPVDAAIRELREETGLRGDSSALSPLGKISPEAGLLKGVVALFGLDLCLSGNTLPDAELGHREMRFFSFRESMVLVEQDKIRDPATLVSIFRYFRGAS